MARSPSGWLATAFQRAFTRKDALTWLPDFLLTAPTKSGATVTWATALQVSAVLACVRVIAEGVAQSACRVMQARDGGGHEPALKHPLYRLLNRRPNAWQTAFEFWETVVLHLLLLGNAFIFISRGAGGRVLELIILDPSRVLVQQNADRSLSYKVALPHGQQLVLGADVVWHVRALSWDGWRGLEAVKLAREAIGLSIALEEAHARLHANGVAPSGVYSVEGALDAKQHAALTATLKQWAAGENRGAPLVLDRAAKWLAQQMTGVDAQHVETRRLQVEEVCRAMRVIPMMVGLAEKTATYASAEQMFLAHEVHTVRPVARRLEQSAEAALLTDADVAAGVEIRIATQDLVLASFKERQEGLQVMRRNGVINADEWRAREGLNPRPDKGGPQYIVEANMALQDGRDLPPPKAAAPAAA